MLEFIYSAHNKHEMEHYSPSCGECLLLVRLIVGVHMRAKFMMPKVKIRMGFVKFWPDRGCKRDCAVKERRDRQTDRDRDRERGYERG